jgi:hypothetical protein
MEGKGTPSNRDFVISLNFFNTPGNEVAPGSDVIRKYFKHLLHLHSFLPRQFQPLNYGSILTALCAGSIIPDGKSGLEVE